MKSTERVFDGLLVLQCRGGDRRAHLLLVKRWHQRFCKQAYWYTKDIDLAKDVVQESWSVIFRKLHTLSDPNSFGSWAMSIVNRRTIDMLRKSSRRSKKLRRYYEDLKDINEYYETNKTDLEGDPSADTNYSEIIMKAIKNLPKNQQSVLRLFYIEEYSLLEISNILGLSQGTVKSRLFYAREKLKSILKHYKNEKS
ncbi:MAG: RNA polymerase sigma factor [Flavobacteriaceae bacterium]|nr:RNA polymerase sigma factor [Flavobacteriaceae bacterium]